MVVEVWVEEVVRLEALEVEIMTEVELRQDISAKAASSSAVLAVWPLDLRTSL